ncbi:oxidoreductase [Candidatus Desulforudis audaxviator]|uniref:Oxidoreductase domain protein n=1 Tax=Desulforudis audaxviator (strain MP104C) TaxID=477974 RepID=B1I154_DESAP|nr:oxidoreductase [Candidatus Desulforudis audaxviator]ACA58591.1 oxidoreductase domain protein [Candidatus Desulforudis audaxviator MP104C]AZK58585.1 putative dehydrogenase [Candidatus Desulforudis audaxviator]
MITPKHSRKTRVCSGTERIKKPAVIAVIGSGVIGRRHLEALSLMDRPVTLEVVDPSAEALLKAERALQEAGLPRRTITVRYRHNLEGLPSKLDLAVVAVKADVRRLVLEDLLARVTVPYLVLEKILFQKLPDYGRIRELLGRNGVKAWVNCPLRAMAFFKLLRRKTEGLPLNYSFCASHLGLGCNSIHHLDLFVFLSGRNDIILDASLLDQELAAAKRPGFVEFTGTLTARNGKGGTVRITSYRRGSAPPMLTIFCESIRFIYRLNEQTAWVAEPRSGWRWRAVPLPFPKQSRLTHLVARQILNEGVSDLPTFEESARLHVLLLQALLPKTGRREWEEEGLCPIT